MTKEFTAALLIIGNEILSGRTEDKNLNYIAKGLSKKGIKFAEARVVADVTSQIVSAVNELRAKHDYVITTGGIGPTHDDITTDAIANAFGVQVVTHLEAEKIITEYYGNRLNDGRLKMSKMPEGAKLIDNPISASPGFYKENVYVLAGIPNIMQAMFDSAVMSMQGGAVVKSKEITKLVSESKIAPYLTKLEDDFADVEVGSYPFLHNKGDGSGMFGVNIVLRGTNEESLNSAEKQLEQMLENIK